MLHAERSDDGSFRLTGHPGILNALWAVPSTLRGVIQNPEDHPTSYQRLYPSTYLDEKKEKEHRRLLGEAMKERQLAKIALFERILTDSGEGMGVLRISERDFDAFVALLTDMRLVLADMLEIDDEDWEDQLTEEQMLQDPRVQLLHLMSGVQQLLLEATGMVSDLDIDPETDL